jgi:acetyltransferase-like isoleucine patch superfamily enzyme
MSNKWQRYIWKLKRTILMGLMRHSGQRGLGRWCTWLASQLVGPYKDKKILANLTHKPYISPKAQIRCEHLSIGTNAFIDDYVTIYEHPDGAGIQVGDRVHIHRGTIIEVGAGGQVTIDADTHIQGNCNLKGFLGSLHIGKHVQLAPQCALSPYEHGFQDRDKPIREQPIHTKGDIVIQDDVWLGIGVVVLDGVTIGQGAVLGARAVVTDDIPAYSIAVGIPAKVIGQRGDDPAESDK